MTQCRPQLIACLKYTWGHLMRQVICAETTRQLLQANMITSKQVPATSECFTDKLNTVFLQF
jgi:hypothetical protein